MLICTLKKYFNKISIFLPHALFFFFFPALQETLAHTMASLAHTTCAHFFLTAFSHRKLVLFVSEIVTIQW